MGRMRSVRTLVTGGAGFIGSHLVGRLLEQGEEVVILDSLEEQVHGLETPALPEHARLLVGDVGDPEIADRALEGVDRVVHLAAVVGVGQSMYEIDRYVRMNTMATATFLERVVTHRDNIAKLVVASSMSIYGEGEYVCEEHGRVVVGPRPEEQLAARRWECVCPACGRDVRPIGTSEAKPLIPTSVYAVSKRDHEELCLVVGAAYGVPTVALRFFNVYGPGQSLSNPYTGVAAIFASRLLNGNAPVIFEDGRQSRDFIHVSDIVEGILLALDAPDAEGARINLGTGRPSTVDEVAAALARGLGVQVEPTRPGQYRAGDIRHCFADTTRANELLGFETSVTLEDGMAAIVEWLREQSANDLVDQATSELQARGLAR
jgi:dTDP-L-rhamnose 4-epimerase